MLRYQRGCFQLEKIIEVKGLSKRFGDVQAVKDIDFHVNAGQLFAFLGPNGAGKSTTIDIICTLLQADSGEVTINGFTIGKDDFAIRSNIGVVFQTNLLDKLLTVKENLEVRGSFYGLSKSEWEPAFLQSDRGCRSNGIFGQAVRKVVRGAEAASRYREGFDQHAKDSLFG